MGLFHYTNATALLGIINKECLWATDAAYLNDPVEVSYAFKLVLNNLGARIDAAKQAGNDELYKVLTELMAAMNEFNNEKFLVEGRPFVTSFAENSESLTLWRLYAGQNGYCIEFDESELLDGGQNINPGLDSNSRFDRKIKQVTYGAEEINDSLELMIESVTNNHDSLTVEARKLFEEVAFIKHKAYENEQEVRMVLKNFSCHATAISRVNSSNQLVPYVEFDFDPSAIRSITLAPGADAESASNALNAFMHDGGQGKWSHVEIHPSTIPFRW